ncbi:MAG: hypothetical protein E4G99_07105, partial [Anaerolineales bacterium]
MAIACALFRISGLSPDQIRIKVNNRRLAEQQLREIGISAEAQPTAYHLIDRIEKMNPSEWDTYAESKGFTPAQVAAFKSHLANQTGWEKSPELIAFFGAADSLKIREFLDFDPTVIRGLDYYTGTVYEARDTAGNFRSILGGGRYDNLVSAVGGEPIPGTGFAMGDVVYNLVLESFGKTPDLHTNPAQIFIPTFEQGTMGETIRLASELREAGFRVEWYPQPVKLPKQFKYSDRQGIPVAVILGPQEVESQTVAVKQMRSGDQEIVARKELIAYLENILA